MAKLYMFSRFYSMPYTPYLCLIFVICLVITTESSVSKNRNKGDFDVSIKTVNGKVQISWNTSSLWQNTTVYFLSNLHDNVTNTSFAVSIGVCNASVSGDKSWKIEPIERNLLEFCNKNRKCGPVDGKTSLVKATESQELSCELFTTCANFDGVYSIRVVSFGGGKEYSFQSANMTILSENVPPFKKIDTNDLYKFGISVKEPVVKYFQPSQLCGFGANPTDSIQFVFKHYRVNESGCFFMGQKTAPYTGEKNTLLTPDNYTGIKMGDIEVLDFTVKFLKNNKTTSWQRLEFKIDTDESYKRKRCSSTGGVIYINWRPQRSCFGEDTIEQARFCFRDALPCYPVCEASFFANGTFRGARTYNNIREGCEKKKGVCTLRPNREKDAKFITVSWSPETGTITCALFRTCMDYLGSFSIKASSMNGDRDVFRETYVCQRDNMIFDLNTPALPHDVHVIDITPKQLTIAWKSPKCELEYLRCEVHININGEQIAVSPTDNTETDGISYFLNYTKDDFFPYQKVSFWLRTHCQEDFRDRAPWTREFNVRTKPSAPNFPPHSLRVESINGGSRLKLTWEYPDDNDLNGVPNETIIVGTNERKGEVFRQSFDGIELTSAEIPVNETQKCAEYKVKFCNTPLLCSSYSQTYQPVCGTGPIEPVPSKIEDSSTIMWISIGSLLGLLCVVVAIVLTTYVLYQRRRRKMRPKLPPLAAENDKTGDYIPIGTLVQCDEYNALETLGKFDTLDKEEHLEELSGDTEVSGLFADAWGTSC